MKNQTKRLVSLALLFAFLIGIFPVSAPSAYAADGVYTAITDYVTPFIGTNYEYNYQVNGVTLAAGCHAFVNSVWKNVFGYDVYSGKSSQTEKSSDYSNFACFIQTQGRIGDILRFDGTHSMLLIGIDQDSITVYESMGHGALYNTVCKSTYTYDKLATRYAGIPYFLYQINNATYQAVQNHVTSSNPSDSSNVNAQDPESGTTASTSTSTDSETLQDQQIENVSTIEAGADPDLQICTVTSKFTSTDPSYNIPNLKQTVMLSANNTFSLSIGDSTEEAVGVLINGNPLDESSFKTLDTDPRSVQITLSTTPADSFNAEIILAPSQDTRISHFIKNSNIDTSFSDVSTSSWFYHSITTTVQYGLLSASNGNFRPFDTLTEGEAIALATRLYSIYYNGISASLSATTPWYQAYEDYCSKEHITDNLTINSTVPITRERFILLLANVFPAKEYSVLYDYTFTGTANKDILTLANAGILSGYTDGSFGVNDLVTREQAATILCRMVDPSER